MDVNKKELHERYMGHILVKFFRKGFSQIFKTDYYDCKLCKATFNAEELAIQHYFSKHKTKNGTKNVQINKQD